MPLDKNTLRLYAITDTAAIGERSLEEAVEAAIAGGATIIQLREKGLDEEALTQEAIRIGRICHRSGIPLIVNDHYRAALRAHADGVHVGITDAPVEEIRRLAGRDFIIGATAKTPAQALAAQAQGADYLGVGAVFPSPTKQDAIRITPAQFREIAGSVRLPAVAIGGITAENLPALQGIGAAGFALVSAVFAQPDITAACRTLRSRIDALLDVPEPCAPERSRL